MGNYNRENELKEKLNSFFERITGEEKDIINKMKVADLYELKSSLSDINNMLTFKTTMSAFKWLSDFFQLNDEIKQKTSNKIKEQRPNTNGFDILIDEDKIKILVEVKSIKPINNGDYFSPAQKDFLMKDIMQLIKGKDELKDKTNDFFKILVVANLGDCTEKAVNSFLNSSKFSTSKTDYRQLYHKILNERQVQQIADNLNYQKLDKEIVYIKLIDVD